MKKLICIFCLCVTYMRASAHIDSLQYSYQKLEIASKPIITSTQDTVISTFVLHFPKFEKQEIDQLINQLLFEFLGKTSSNTSYEQIAQEFLNEANEMNTEQDAYPMAWYRKINLRVVPQISGTQTLSFSLDDESFTGGAHPNSNTYFFNFETNTLEAIQLSDFINPIMMARLNYIADTIFRKQEGLSADQALTDYTFEDGRFKLNNNFLIQENGLKFWYNNYEIRPYAFGPLELIIPFKEINDLLISDSPYLPKKLN